MEIKKNISGFDVTIRLVDVTPRMAQEILDTKNTKNRAINKNHLLALVKNIKNGTWRFNGDTICFDANGTLIDGQHRLRAIALSDTPVLCLFVEGLDPETIKTKDMEIKPRNLHDLLRMDGVPEANNTAAIIMKYMALKLGLCGIKGGSTHGGNVKEVKESFTIDDKYDFYYANMDVVDEITAYSRTLYKRNRIITLSEIGGIFCHLYFDKHHSEEEIKGFFDGLFTSSNMNVVNELRNKLIKDLTSVKKMSGAHRQAYIAKTWNYYIRKKDVSVLSYTATKEGVISFI